MTFLHALILAGMSALPWFHHPSMAEARIARPF